MVATVGIDISEQRICIAASDRSGKPRFLVHELAGQEPKEALRALVAEHGLVGSHAHIAVRSEACFTRNFSFGFSSLKRSEMDQVVGTELESELPLDLEDITFGYESIPAQSDGLLLDDGASAISTAGMRVLAAALPIAEGQRDIAIVEQSGLVAKRLFVAPGISGAICQQLIEVDDRIRAAETVALLDMGAVSSEVCVVHNGTPVFARTVPRGHSDLVESVMRAWKTDEQQATQLVYSCGLDPAMADIDDVHSKYFRLVGNEIMSWARDLERALLSCQKKTGFVPTMAVVVGAGGAIKGIDTMVASRLEIPVLSGDALPIGQIADSSTPADVFSYGAWAAGALWESKSKKPRFDLRKGPLSGGGDFAHLVGPALRGALALGVILLFGAVALTASIYSKKQENAALKTRVELESMALYQSSVGFAPSQIEQMDEGAVESNDELPSMSAYDVLLAINNALPSRENVTIEVDTLEVDDSKVEIEFRAKSSEEIDAVEKAIGGIDCLKKESRGDQKLVANDMQRVSLTFESTCWRGS